MNFTDKRGREWEMFIDRSYFDYFCVRLTSDRDFNSNTSFISTQTHKLNSLLNC